MKILVIQTIRPQIELMLLDEQYKFIDRSSWESAKDEVARVVPGIAGLLKKNGLDFQQLGKILVINGVGGFSSTRIGVTIANVLGMAIGAEIFEMTWNKENQGEELEKLVGKFFKENPRPVKLAQPIYGAEPMISPSKKKKLV